MQAWHAFLNSLKDELGAENIDQWARPLKIAKFDARNLYLEAEDSFQISWFNEHIRPRLISFVSANQKPIKVHLGQGTPSPKKPYIPKPISIVSDELHPHYLFDHFTETEGNKLAFNFLKELPSSLGAFNPLFLFGGKGTGKTHLLTAIAHSLKTAGKQIFFVNAQTFTEHVVYAIRTGIMEEFRKAYRLIDVLIMDDVHIFARKAATQEEFFHTFNTLHTLGKQIILSAEKPPSEIAEIEPRLLSRFEWGLSLSLTLPTDSELPKIFQAKAKALHLPTNPEMEKFFIEHFKTPSDLSSALETLALKGNLGGLPTHTLPFIHESLKDILAKNKEEQLSPTKILKKVSDHFGLKPTDLTGKAQTKEVSFPRQIAMYFCRTRLKMPLMKIGELFSRDHSTVITAVRQIENALEKKEGEVLNILSRIELE